ncbi:hypothetical protein ACJQWK_04595 [Exserohilum turcicum]
MAHGTWTLSGVSNRDTHTHTHSTSSHSCILPIVRHYRNFSFFFTFVEVYKHLHQPTNQPTNHLILILHNEKNKSQAPTTLHIYTTHTNTCISPLPAPSTRKYISPNPCLSIHSLIHSQVLNHPPTTTCIPPPKKNPRYNKKKERKKEDPCTNSSIFLVLESGVNRYSRQFSSQFEANATQRNAAERMGMGMGVLFKKTVCVQCYSNIAARFFLVFPGPVGWSVGRNISQIYLHSHAHSSHTQLFSHVRMRTHIHVMFSHNNNNNKSRLNKKGTTNHR